MNEFLLILGIIISVLLIILITIQAKGKGLGSTFGSGSQSSFSRRGLEKLLYKFTFILAGLFIIVSIASLLI
ncbi:MAG: preprotein translocase subunit SecG [bacterium]